MVSQKELISNICNESMSNFQVLTQTSKLFTPTFWFLLATMFLILVMYFLLTGFYDREGKRKINLFQPNVIFAILLTFAVASLIIIFSTLVPIIPSLLNGLVDIVTK